MTYAETLGTNYKRFQDTVAEQSHKAFEKGKELLEQAQKSETWTELTERGRELPEWTVERFELIQERLEPEVKKLGEHLEKGAVALLHGLGLPHANDVAELAGRVEALAQEVSSLRGRVVEAMTTVYEVLPSGAGWEVATSKPEAGGTLHGNKKEAVAVGRELAHQHQPSRLVVYRKDGTVQDTFAYGEL